MISYSKTTVKIMFVILMLIYVNYFNITISTNRIDAVATLAFSGWLLVKARHNILLTLVVFFLLYCNYSIVMGEYIIGGHLGVPLFEVKTLTNYGINIRTLLLFTGILSIFYNGKKLDPHKFQINPKDNIVIYTGLLFVLFFILIFGVVRGNLDTYSVSITPMYEYSSLLFLFSYYFSGKSAFRRGVLLVLITLFVLQDFYYGGRITAMQLVFLALTTLFVNRLSIKSIFTYGFFGVLLNSIVGVYRNNYSFNAINVSNVFTRLKNTYFVFDTPVYAYYASATHIASAEVADSWIKFSSFFAFIGSVLFGLNREIGNVTIFVSNKYFQNLGGGIIPTHFYFWFGIVGVVLIATVVVLGFNKLGSGELSDFQKLFYIILIATVPRWYLYSPLSMFRPLVFLVILYFVLLFAHKVLVELGTNKAFVRQ